MKEDFTRVTGLPVAMLSESLASFIPLGLNSFFFVYVTLMVLPAVAGMI